MSGGLGLLFYKYLKSKLCKNGESMLRDGPMSALEISM
jgi:hypothetical protein